MTEITQLPIQDGRIIHALKETPAWVVLGLFVAVFLAAWYIAAADFIPRIIDGLIGALLLSLQRKPTNSATTDSGDVNVALSPNKLSIPKEKI